MKVVNPESTRTHGDWAPWGTPMVKDPWGPGTLRGRWGGGGGGGGWGACGGWGGIFEFN